MAPKVGLALGGGGARGLAHVGILRLLQKEKIPIHFIAGSSIGAIVGAMYAQNPDVNVMTARFNRAWEEGVLDHLGLGYLRKEGAQEGSFFHQASRSIKRRIVMNLAESRSSLLHEKRFLKVLSHFIDEGNIENTRIPLAIVATSLRTGEDVVFRTGDIASALSASASIPGFFPPISKNGDLLTDGGVSCPVPVRVLQQMGADVTIGVDVSMRQLPQIESPSVIDIIFLGSAITAKTLARLMVERADISILPDTQGIHWSDFSKFDELVHAGEISAEQHLSTIKKRIRKKRPWYQRPFS